MGQQSITPFSYRAYVPLRIALLLLFALTTLRAPAQTSGFATLLPLLLPSAVAFDAQGNLYVAETSNHVIRKIDRNGNLTTVAGTGTQGFGGDGGLAIAAQLDSPQGLAVDANQNLYIADTHNHRIRKLSLVTGIIATIAGTGTPGFAGDNASAAAAQLNLPTALALDSNKNLYLADTANHRVRKIAVATGQITTVAGDGVQGFAGDNGTATAASIDSPTGIAVDAAGNLYLADTHNQRIRRISAAGIITTLAGTGVEAFSGDNAAASHAALALPHGLTLDAAGNLYLADTANHRIRRIDAATSQITTVAGEGTQAFAGDNGPATAASLNSPRAVVATANAPLVVADTGNQRIRQVKGDSIQTFFGIGVISAPSQSDFTLAPTGSLSQTIVSGGDASFAFSVAIQGDPLSSPIALAATGLPRLATASFSPAYLPAGATSNSFTLRITVPATAAESRTPAASPLFFAILCLPMMSIPVRRRGRHKRQTLLALLLLTGALTVCSGCGDRIRLGTLAKPLATPYTVTVSGTATTPTGAILQHSATVTLLIQSGS